MLSHADANFCCTEWRKKVTKKRTWYSRICRAYEMSFFLRNHDFIVVYPPSCCLSYLHD